MRWICALLVVAGLLAGAGPAAAQAPPDGAVLAPDGKRAVWPSEDGQQLWSATRATPADPWRAPLRLLTIRGTIAKPVFSPDSKRIAFENRRGTTHGFIVVFDLPADKILYVDPVFATDTDPAWSADGTHISFIRRFEGLPAQPLTRPAPQPDSWQMPLPRPGDTYPIEAALRAPIAYAPEPSQDGTAIAYISWEATTRAISFMRIGESARRVVEYADDDGIELSQLAMSAHGDAVAFVRGGAPNSQGDSPNPRSLPDPPQREVWITGTRAGSPRNLGRGTAPIFAPDDSRLVWIDGTRLVTAELTWGDEGRLADVGTPATLATLAGAPSNLRFSPDGSRLAFQRGSAIELLELATRATTAIPRPSGSDAGPVWSPDGMRIAYRHTVSGQPWAIWIADVPALTTRQVWQANPGVGEAFYQLDQNPTFQSQPGDQLLWSDDDQLAFAWEGDGFRHLYSVPAAGGEARLLTPGEGEVESAEVTLDRKRIVYTTNIGDLGRRHLYSVGFDGGEPTPLTGGRESQWAPTPLAEGQVAYINAGWATPPSVFVRGADGASERARLPVVPATFPAEHMVEPQLVEFPATDGQKAYGQLFVPKHPKGCASIFPHGGPRRAMLPGFHYYDTYSNLYELNQYLASRGCVVLSVDYRGGIMHGYEFRNAPDRGTTLASEYRDILGGVEFLKARDDVDPERIGTHGLSWGGYLVALGLARNSEIFKVGFDMAGTHAGPIASIDTWNSPVMLVQGDDDRNVNFSQGTNLVRELLTKRPHVELVQRVFPNEVHDLYLTFEDTVDTYNMGAQFLLDHLIGQDAVEVPGDVGGTVPSTLSLTLGGQASFSPFTPGVAREYTASAVATVTSSAADAALTVIDPSAAHRGHLVNGSFALAEPLLVGGKPIPATLKTWDAPTAGEQVEIGFEQSIGASEALRTGTYAKTLTFTLSTTRP